MKAGERVATKILLDVVCVFFIQGIVVPDRIGAISLLEHRYA
jgi:hypothetical protein